MESRDKQNYHDVIGKAMWLHCETAQEVVLPLTIDGEEDKPLVISHFFRDISDMPPLEYEALSRAFGRVLDVGAGAGCHTLALQQRGFDTTSVELSPMACRVLKFRGAQRVVNTDILDFHQSGFDTVLLLMNGLGVARDEMGLEVLLAHLKTLLNPGGSILADSTRLNDWDEHAVMELSEGYFGEVTFRVTNGSETDEFGWIYPDEHLLRAICEDLQLEFEVISYGDRGAFLCKMTLQS